MNDEMYAMHNVLLYYSVVMIGDGATDLEACPPAVSTYAHISTYFVILYYHVSITMMKIFEPT